MLIDSFTGYFGEALNEVKPRNKNVLLKIIPEGTSGKIQPLDVLGFRIWKNNVKTLF